MAAANGRPRIVIVGGGFAGYHAAKTLCRLARGAAEIVVINPTDYFLYLPLLPRWRPVCSIRAAFPCRFPERCRR